VAAEVAGLLRSDDDGRTWVCEPVTEDEDEDLHHITGHPDHPDLLYVATGTASPPRDRSSWLRSLHPTRDGSRRPS
jgi:hypothetical protein